ncbi:MAG: hypothetical protein P4L35_14280, partial [Ignavibacteriaceae bacterium]|nr:hypothetical protein [Ignavibacteriaceae bacterium]
MEEHRTLGSRIILGIILIAIGGLYLLKSFYPYLDIEIFSFPFILIIIGIVVMFNSRNKLFGAVLFIAGLLIYFSDKIDVGPLLIILLGIYIIFKHRNGRARVFGNPFPQPDANTDEKKDFRDDIADFVKSEKRRYYDSSLKKD